MNEAVAVAVHAAKRKWGPVYFGGGIVDERDESTAREDLALYDAQYLRFVAERERRALDEGLGQAYGDGEAVSDQCLYWELLVAGTRNRLQVLEFERNERAQRRTYEDRISELNAALGGERPVAVSAAEFTAQADRAAMARMMGGPDANDPSEQATARAELDSRDPALQARLGNSIPSAIDVMLGRVDPPARGPAVVKRAVVIGVEERR